MMSNSSLADFNGASPGRCSDWLDTATVTAQGLSSRSTRRARDGDLHPATSGDFSMATSGDFGTATDIGRPHRRVLLQGDAAVSDVKMFRSSGGDARRS